MFHSVTLAQSSDIAATLKQTAASDSVAINMNTVMKFDGYAIFDCSIMAKRDTTHFRANWIIVPTKLTAGQTLHYRFALQATPVKLMLRDSWDLRIIRSDPYTGNVGNLDFNLPDRYVDADHEVTDRLESPFAPGTINSVAGKSNFLSFCARRTILHFRRLAPCNEMARGGWS